MTLARAASKPRHAPSRGETAKSCRSSQAAARSGAAVLVRESYVAPPVMTIDVAAVRATIQKPSYGLITRARLYKSGPQDVARLAAWLGLTSLCVEHHACRTRLVDQVEAACK